jgi:exopolysaccharide production protein ExoZ
MLIVGSALCLEHDGIVRHWRIPKLLGDASYSIYLAHGVFLSPARALYFKTSLPRDGFFVIGVVGSVLAGLAVYQLIEAPLTARIRDRRLRDQRPVASDSVAADVVGAEAPG